MFRQPFLSPCKPEGTFRSTVQIFCLQRKPNVTDFEVWHSIFVNFWISPNQLEVFLLGKSSINDQWWIFQLGTFDQRRGSIGLLINIGLGGSCERVQAGRCSPYGLVTTSFASKSSDMAVKIAETRRNRERSEILFWIHRMTSNSASAFLAET